MRESLPQQIGRYGIIRLLGEGGMARAYLAVSRGPAGFHKLAVIKQILPNLASDADFITMFLDEARLAARLHHPNIVQTFDVAEHDGSYLLTMEYLDGQSLSSIYRRIHPKTIPLETHLWILTEVLKGLHYAHTLHDYDGTPLGVVHRDVSPANVLVTYAGEVKLLDFGVAKARGTLATDKGIKGKPGYCSPEQLRKGEPDARADVFAVGVMLWEVLAGRRLNRGSSLMEVARVRLAGQEPKIRDVRPDADPLLADLCDRALAINPADRFATAAEFQLALQAQLNRFGQNGRLALIEMMEKAFFDDRVEVRKLIEKRLVGTSVEFTALDLATPSKPSLAPAPASTAEPQPAVRTGMPKRWIASLAVVAAVAAAAGVVLVRMPQEAKVGTENKPAATAFPTAVTKPLVETLAPVPVEPAKPAEKTVEPTPVEPVVAESVAAKSPAPVPAMHPPRPAHAAMAAKRPSGPTEAMNEPAATARAAATKRRVAPEETQGSVAPGTHLLRPAGRPARSSIDEKDPYSP